jgi:predicted Zn-dependent protease DUF2268
MRTFAKLAVLTAIILLGAQGSFAVPAPPDERSGVEGLLEGPKIINIVDDVLAFWDQARDKPLALQRKMWIQIVESKNRAYFDRAVYRTADPKERRAILNQFLTILPSQIDAIREFNYSIYTILTQVFVDFKVRFLEYRQQRDIYIGVSLSRFDGSVRPIQNEKGFPDTLCIAADVMSGYTSDQVRVTLAHELFHLYHFGFLFQQEPSLKEFRAAHIRLMVEGLAVASVEDIYGNRPKPFYLHFSDQEFEAQMQGLTRNSKQFLRLMRQNATPEEYEPWFVANSAGLAPPRGGYLLGYETARRLRTFFTLEQLVRMSPVELREHAERQLAILAHEGLVLMASSE